MALAKDTQRGTWYFYGYYRDMMGTKHRYFKRGFKTKKEAKEAERILRLSNQDAAPSITLDDLVGIYHENFPSLGIKEVTLITDEGYYRNHIKEELGGIQLKDIKTPVVHRFIKGLAQKKQPNGKDYTASTINHAKNVLSKYMRYAVLLGYIEYNPCHGVPSFKNSEQIKDDSHKFWEVETFNYFINEVDDDYWKLVFSFLFWTGVREGELFALQWKDIDLAKQTAYICKTVTSKTSLSHYKITSPKNEHAYRTIDLQDILISALRSRYKEEINRDGFSSEWFVFGHVAPLSRSQLARFLDKYILQSGVPRITPHGFRHSHASFLISRHFEDQLIADRLGHTIAILHKTYAHIYKSNRTEMRDRLNDVIE